MLSLLLIACAPEGTNTDESERESYQDRREDESDEPTARTCDEALIELGYDPWHYTGDPYDNAHFFPEEPDFDATQRKWMVVRWEAENEVGFRVSCESLDGSPEVELGKPEYWACSLEAGVDPYADPNCSEGLIGLAYVGGVETDNLPYLDEEGDGIYVPEE